MTPDTRPKDARTTGPAAVTASIRRIWALARAETVLVLRNRTAIFVGLGLPIATVFLLVNVGGMEENGLGTGATTLISLIALALLYVVYYNLVSTYVARREDLVLKRLRTGELSDSEILAGVAVPAVALAVGQVLVGAAAAVIALGLDTVVNPVLLVVAVAGGSVVFVLIAAVSATFTRNVEMAQMSTLPVFGVSLLFSGLLFPVDRMADRMADIAQFLPLTPVVELSRLGVMGTTGDAAAVGFSETFTEAGLPAAILVAWIVVGVILTRRTFRWEPRR